MAGLANILKDCLARVMVEQKLELPADINVFWYMRTFIKTTALSPTEKEHLLNTTVVTIFNEPSPIQAAFNEVREAKGLPPLTLPPSKATTTYKTGVLPLIMLSPQAKQLILDANPNIVIHHTFIYPEEGEEKRSLVASMVDASTVNVDGFLTNEGYGQDTSTPTLIRIPGTLPKKDFLGFVNKMDQEYLQQVFNADPVLAERFYSFMFGHYTLAQLKTYRDGLIGQGIDVSECSDAYIAELDEYLKDLLLQQKLGASVVASEVFKYL